MEERLRGLEEKLVALSEKDPYREPVGWAVLFLKDGPGSRTMIAGGGF